MKANNQIVERTKTYKHAIGILMDYLIALERQETPDISLQRQSNGDFLLKIDTKKAPSRN